MLLASVGLYSYFPAVEWAARAGLGFELGYVGLQDDAPSGGWPISYLLVPFSTEAAPLVALFDEWEPRTSTSSLSLFVAIASRGSHKSEAG